MPPLLAVAALALLAPPPDPAALVRDLGSPAFATREQASRDLWKLGRAARPALAAAVLSPDPEVRRRAAAVLDRFDWGIYPDTPPEVVRLIHQFRAGPADRQHQAVNELLRLNDRGLDALAAILAREYLPERRREVFEHLTKQMRKVLPADLLAGRLDRAERLLEAAALGGKPDAWADYAVFMHLRGRLPAADRILAGYLSLPGGRGESARGALGWVRVLAGRPADAADAVRVLYKTAHDDYDWPGYLESVAEEAGRWAELAKATTDPGLELFRTQRAGDAAGADAFAARLAGPDPVADPEATAVALLLNRRTADGLRALGRFPGVRPDLRTDLLAARADFAAALMLTEPAAEDEAAATADFRARRGRLLAQVGRFDEADRAFAAALNPRLVDINTWKSVVNLLRAEVRAGRTELAAAHAARVLDQMDRMGEGGDWSPSPFELLFEDDAEAARGWWTALRKHGPKEEPAAAMIRVRELLAGTASADRRAAADAAMERWHEAVHRADYPAPADRLRLALARGAAARAVGDVAAAERHLAAATVVAGQAQDDADGDEPKAGPRAWVYGTDERFRPFLDHGDLLAELNRPKDAAAVYLDGWRRFPDNPILLYLSGRALLAAGDREEGERRVELAHWVPLGNARMRGRFLDELCSRGRRADLRRGRDLARATVWFWSAEPGWGNVWNQVARASALLADFPAAADATDRYLNFILRTNAGGNTVSFIDGGAYAHVPMNAVRFRARAALAAGDAAGAVRLAEEYYAVLPANPDPAAELVPALDAAGKTAEADALFRRVWGTYQTLTAEHPASSWARANAASLAAACRRELDAGLALARRAVELDPRSPAAREALAEVHFRRGERAEAVRLMEELAKAEPRSRLYRRQLERYRSGDVSSRVPIGPTE